MACHHEIRERGVVTIVNSSGPPKCGLCTTDQLRAEVDTLRELLGRFADANDCPVCLASPELVGAHVETYLGGNQTVSGGRWVVKHGVSCDVGRALEKRSAAK